MVDLSQKLEGNTEELRSLKVLNKVLYLKRTDNPDKREYVLSLRLYVEASVPADGSFRSHVKLLKKELKKALKRTTRTDLFPSLIKSL